MASNDLKRVGLVFKADGTVDFIKSLSSINNELKQNFENFKLTQAQYDKNTSSMDKLKDRYSYLTDAIEAQSKKVMVLEEQLEQLENAEVKDEQAIEKKRIALTSAEASLERYKNQQRELGEEIKKGTANIEDFANKLNESSKKIVDVGKKASIASAAVGAIGFAGLKVASDFEEAMSSVKAISGATGEDFDNLKAKAEYMGSTTKFTATEAANAMYYMALAGWKTKDMLDGLEGVMYLAAASGEDLASTSDIVTDGLTAMGYAANSSGHFADVLARTVTNSNSTVATLGDALKYTGSIAGALNLDIEDVALALGLMANSGVKASQAGTSLRAILQRLSTDTGGACSTLEDLGIKIFDNKGRMKDLGEIISQLRVKFSKLTDEQKTSIAKTVAGANGMSGFLAIVNSGDEDFNKLTSAISNCNGAAEEMSKIMIDNVKGDLTLLKSQAEGIAITFMKNVMPALRSFLGWIQKILTSLSEMSPTQQKIILAISAIVIAIGPLLIMIGKIGTGISALIKAITIITPLFKGIISLVGLFTSSLSPTILIIAAVAAAVAGLAYLIYSNWESIVTWTKNLCENISSGFQEVCDFLKEMFTDFVEWLKGIGDQISQVFSSVCEFVIEIFNTDWSEAFGAAGNILNAFLANIKNIFNSIKTIFSGIITFVKGVFTGDWKQAWQGVQNVFKGIFDMLFSIAKSPINLIIGALNTLIQAFNKVIEGINKIQLPDWGFLGSLAGKGFNIPTIKKIAYLATGGELIRGTAMVGEAGPEILENNNGRPKVYPLNNVDRNAAIIDYVKMTKAFIDALNSCKMKLDKDGFIRFIDNRLYEVM